MLSRLPLVLFALIFEFLEEISSKIFVLHSFSEVFNSSLLSHVITNFNVKNRRVLQKLCKLLTECFHEERIQHLFYKSECFWRKKPLITKHKSLVKFILIDQKILEIWNLFSLPLKFIYSEKATKIWQNIPVD